MSLLLDGSFLAAALAHLAVDVLNAQRPVLLAVLSGPLGLSNALLGLISAVYTLSGSLSQPLFGWISDRLGGRWLAAGGVLWMCALFGLAVRAQGNLSLVLLILAALGSAAFHPAGTVEAAEVGRVRFRGQETTAASIFFLFGQAGYSFGPAIGGPIVDRWGPPGLLLLVPLVVASGLNVGVRFPVAHAIGKSVEPGGPAAPPRRSFWVIAAFIALAAFRMWSQSNMTTFIPKYYSDLGFSATHFGVIAALFMGGSALGGVAGGWLADRHDRRKVTVWSLLGGSVVLALFPGLSLSAWAYVLAAAAGALTGAPHSILIVEAQRMMPGRKGAASGLALGFMFAAGSLGTLVSGIQADAVGFSPVFLTTAGITLLAAVAGLWLPQSGR